MRTASVPPCLALIIALAAPGAHPASAAGEDPDSPAARLEALTQLKRDLLWDGVRARSLAAARPAGAAAPPAAPVHLSRLGAPFAAQRALMAPPDVIVNDNSNDLLLSITNAEVAMGAVGGTLIAAWNDGAGNDRQGWALSTNDGFTWFDAGAMPPIGNNWRWRSDPTIATDPGGRIFFCALAESSTTRNAIVIADFDVLNQVWSPARFVRRESHASVILDKQWIAYDATFDVVHVVYTMFDIPGATNAIEHMRGTGGGTSWSLPVTLSSAADAGRVQGARVVSLGGGGGDVAAVWAALGTPSPDHIRFRRTFGGVWDPEFPAADFYNNIGTGAPGFNRPVAVYFPSLAVDRVPGSPTQGRIWLAWSEAYNSEDDILSFPPVVGGATIAEAEPNGTLATATGFTPGDILRGFSAATSDADYFSCFLNAGEHLIVWADSLPAAQLYELEVRGPADVRLARGGDTRPGGTASATYYTITAPVAATYAVRFDPTSAGVAGGYRIRTLLGQANSGERGRDRRDAFASFTDNGTAWSLPDMASDSPVGFDDWLPEIQVAEDGFAHTAWYDFRDHVYGAESHVRVAAAHQAGLGWLGSHVLSSALSDWSGVSANLAPNQGDYLALIAQPSSRLLRAGWADARNPTPDVYTNAIHTDFRLTCPPDLTAPAGSMATQTIDFDNVNALYDYDVEWTYFDQSGWLTPVTTVTTVPAGTSVQAVFSYTVPNVAPGTVLTMEASPRLKSGPLRKLCTWQLTVTAAVSAGPVAAAEFALEPVFPNPARGAQRVAFSLPAAARATLAIYDLAGARVRMLASGEFSGGRHDIHWDGRDAAGRIAPAGVYYMELEAGGRRLTRRFVRLR